MLTRNKRRDRVGEMLREEISLILLKKSSDPRLHEVTITAVEVSSDLRQAKVFYLLRANVSEPAGVQKALQKATGFIKQELAQEHILRIMPELSFRLDESWQRGERLAELMRRLHQPEPPTDDSQGSP